MTWLPTIRHVGSTYPWPSQANKREIRRMDHVKECTRKTLVSLDLRSVQVSLSLFINDCVLTFINFSSIVSSGVLLDAYTLNPYNSSRNHILGMLLLIPRCTYPGTVRSTSTMCLSGLPLRLWGTWWSPLNIHNKHHTMWCHGRSWLDCLQIQFTLHLRRMEISFFLTKGFWLNVDYTS